MAVANRKLGKGLSALIADEYSEHTLPSNDSGTKGIQMLPVSSIRSGRFQPRRHFDERFLQELSESIARSGVMQPIIVRPDDRHGDGYEIIAGERRWRATQMAGETAIPVIIRDISDQQALELALVENIQRQDLTPLEEAEGYQRLMDEFSYTQEELAQTVGKSRSHIANLLRLLNLPDPVKEMLNRGELTMGHARAMMTAQDPISIANEVIKRNLNVRQTENLARTGLPKQVDEKTARLSKPKSASAKGKAQDADMQALEETLTESLGMRVKIHGDGQSGQVALHYESLEQLDDILRRLSGGI